MRATTLAMLPLCLALLGCPADKTAPGAGPTDPSAGAAVKKVDSPTAKAPTAAAPESSTPKELGTYRLTLNTGGKQVVKQDVQLSTNTRTDGLRALAWKAGDERQTLLYDGKGKPVGGSEPAVLALLQSAGRPIKSGETRTIPLPSGGWLKVTPRVMPGKASGVRQVKARVTGKLSTGERFRGKVSAELTLDAEQRLVKLRAKEQLKFERSGTQELELSFGKEGAKTTRVGSLPPAYRSPRSVSPASVAFGACFLLILGAAPWLRGQKTLCLLLCLVMIGMPLAEVEAQSWWKRFSDPTGNEIGWTVVGALVTGLAAAVAVVTAPAWVPVAIGVAGVAAIGTYWVTRTPPIRKGTIVAKRYEKPRTYLTYITTPVVTTNGKTTTTTFVMTPMWIYDDEDYVITIKDGERDREIYLSAEEYARVKQGQEYDMDAHGGVAEDQNKQRKASGAEVEQLEKAKARGDAEVELTGSGGGISESLDKN